MDRQQLIEQLIAQGLLKDIKSIRQKPLEGGVSSDIFLVSDGTTKLIVKQALEKLKVKDDWYADTARNKVEYTFMGYVQAFMPESVPKLMAANEEDGYFVMEYLDESYRNWKEALLAGIFNTGISQKAAECLARLHTTAFKDQKLKELFPKNDFFYKLRIEPYLLTTGNRHPNLKGFFYEEAERLQAREVTLIHGDFSPKNIMIGNNRLVLLDHEVACVGDPIFDIAFLLTHLFLKKLYLGAEMGVLPDISRIFLAQYDANSSLEKLGISGLRIGRLLLLLLLARVDGKSPVEYLDENKQNFVRTFVAYNLQKGNVAFSGINDEWNEEIQKRFK
jgi:aminoglycoside phosphotransferase (APT) family kinase protein